MALEQRIVKYGEEDPRTLSVHPFNFRTHPNHQHEVVEGSLDELGWIDDVLVNLRTGEEWPEEERNVKTVINGHLRRNIAIAKDEATVPCKFVDLSPEEERLALAVFDESTALAQRDVDKLGELLELINPGNQTLADFLAELADEAGAYPDFSDMEDLTDEPEESYKDTGQIVVKIGNYAAHREATDVIASLLEEHPEWEATLAS